jgi:hypothetical protein
MLFIEPVPKDSNLAIEKVKDEARNRGVAIVEGKDIEWKFPGSDIKGKARVHFALIDILTEFGAKKEWELWYKVKTGAKETSVQHQNRYRRRLLDYVKKVVLAPKWAH